MAIPTTEDALFDGTLRLIQPAKGHRAGTDAVLLAAACPAGGASIVDLGCGVGAVGLRVAQRHPEARVVLIDNDAAILELAGANCAANGLTGRCQVVSGDVLSRDFAEMGALAEVRADVVLTNPPFAGPERGRMSPHPFKASAHVMTGSLEVWVKGAMRLLAPQGELVLIHRADALAMVLAALGRRFGAVRIIPVHPAAGDVASRILVRARLGSRAPLKLLPPLVLHGADGAFTPQADALHRGSASIQWD